VRRRRGRGRAGALDVGQGSGVLAKGASAHCRGCDRGGGPVTMRCLRCPSRGVRRRASPTRRRWIGWWLGAARTRTPDRGWRGHRSSRVSACGRRRTTWRSTARGGRSVAVVARRRYRWACWSRQISACSSWSTRASGPRRRRCWRSWRARPMTAAPSRIRSSGRRAWCAGCWAIGGSRSRVRGGERR
jgi:hypothetical protein